MLYFLVYDDNTGNYNNYFESLLESVKKYGKEFDIIIFNKNDIDEKFKTDNHSIFSLHKGGGYWLWKSYIINKTLEKLNENDILFYLDSKYYFLEDFKGLYDDYLLTNDILIFKNKPNEPSYFMKNWCKMDVIVKYDIYDEVFNKNADICWAGAIILKKNKNSEKYMKEWLDISCDYQNITDSPSILKNSDDFIEHRHDQSCLSVVLIKNNINIVHFENKYLQNIRIPFTP
jgi:hypothetical protein